MTAGPVTYERARDWLIERASVVAGIPAHEVAIDVSFTDLGLTSASLAALTRELETFLGTSVDPAVPFEFPTIDKLARRLAAGHTTRRVASTTPSADVSVREIAIVGMACRFPEAESLDRFWKLLHHGMDGTSEVPAGRWEAGQPVHGTLPAGDGVALSRGGFINAIEWFDRRFFRIGAEEAARMDPQQRILLELCWEALEDAGELPSRLRGSRTGVYVGISTSEYLARLGDDPSPYVSTGNARSVAANRVSYLFDFRGPSISVDTACSSSLVAVHLACRGLRTGECDRAVVAGVNLMLDPRTTVWLSRAGLLSNEGRCKAFDASADGYVRAEGCGVVVLKGLDAARAANDRIYAIVRGSAVNQDGTTNGLTAPNPSAQRAVVRDAYRDADLDPTRVGYVECHGTGTALGDPIEARSLSAVVRPRGPSGDVCLIGSVKTNVGHLEAAAGIAGLIKVALSLHHGEIPPSLHFRDANPHIPFEELALRVATRPAPWPAQDRLAGVSSFGFGGTNAHVVVASGPPIPDRSPRPGPLILPVSAPTATGLGRLVRAWSRRLATTTETDLGDVLHAAAVRRTHHPAYRRAFTGTDPDDLRDQVDTAARRGTGRQRIAPAATPRVMFVFSGHCAELPSGVVQALAEHPLFANTLQRCDEVLSAQRPSPVEEMPERAHDPGAVDA
ncbi:MAG TPA: beta-ketoacyl synthase N-terminal-like domain-containing protein, partial [Actinomycetota bacterium]